MQQRIALAIQIDCGQPCVLGGWQPVQDSGEHGKELAVEQQLTADGRR